MTRRLLLAAAALSLLAGCGADKETPTAPAADKNKQALLDYAKCMRENGIDMPDPQFDGGRVTMRAGGPGQKLDPDTMRAAEKACAKYQEAVEPPELSDEEQAEFKEAALEHARCMRDNGVPDFPDPQFDENGGAQIRIGKGLNPESATFQQAQKACEKTLPRPEGDEG
jgi:hypothetical protein